MIFDIELKIHTTSKVCKSSCEKQKNHQQMTTLHIYKHTLVYFAFRKYWKVKIDKSCAIEVEEKINK